MDLFAKFKSENNWEPFDTYAVKIKFADLVGGAPKTEKMIEGWINSTNKERTTEVRQQLVDAAKETLPELVDEQAEKNSIGFKSDERGLFIEGRQIQAMLKESGNIIKDIAPGGIGKGKTDEEKGVLALKKKISENVFVMEDRIYLGRAKPDAIEERPIHVMTAQGPRTSIKCVEVCRDVEVAFTLKRRVGNIVTLKTLLAVLDYAQSMGGGADRSQGRGRFAVLSVDAA